VNPGRFVVLRAYQRVQQQLLVGANRDSLKTSVQAVLGSLGGRYDAKSAQ
jgi:hypothetical protein